MHFKTVLLISATLMGFVTFAEAGCATSKNSENGNNEKGREAVEFANSQDNPLRELSNTPRTFDCNGETMTIECIKGSSLSRDRHLHNWVQSLLERNMADTYKENTSNSGSRVLMRQFTTDTAYLLIIRSSFGNPVALSSFRFEMEEKCDEEVVYCMEIQVEESMRGRAGTYLLNTVTDIAEHFNMRKTMLTVFTKNSRSYSLYERCGFSVDETSPKQKYFRILSKPNPSFRE